MEFLNLSLGQFLALFSTVAAFAVTLYLLDRARRRQVVSTLRFWEEPGKAAPVHRRNRIQQPWSLLLQLLGMGLLLLALAQFAFGGRRNTRHDHVLVLDTSAWMGASLPNRPDLTLMDLARASALAWLRAVPTVDRVLVVRADALATPATSWETDRRKTARAILESKPGATALNLSQSLTFARGAQQHSGSRAGEIVYDGPGRLSLRESNNLALPQIPVFRVLAIDDNLENSGLRSVGARRSTAGDGIWDVIVRARNYGRRPKTVNISLNFGGAPQGTRALELPAGAERETTFPVNTRAAGILEARLYPRDSFGPDNYVALELPELKTLPVIVYSDQPDDLRPALASDSRVEAEFRRVDQYRPEAERGENQRTPSLTIFHHFRPLVHPRSDALWIDPQVYDSPIPVRERVDHPQGLNWTPDEPLTLGLRARDVQIETTSVFDAAATDIRLAAIDKGPVMVARVAPNGVRTIVIGFDPFEGPMRYELMTPLLLANVLRWMAPDVFRDVDVGTQSAGAVAMVMTSGTPAGAPIQVVTDAGVNLPYSVRDKTVEFFAGQPSRVRVISGASERVYSLTLPEMWDVKWTPPSNVKHGVPAGGDSLRSDPDLWPFLAALGMAILAAEWIIWGRYSPVQSRVLKPRLDRAA